jgi:hypothetical protein
VLDNRALRQILTLKGASKEQDGEDGIMRGSMIGTPVVNARSMRCAGHVVHMEEEICLQDFGGES